MRLKAPATILCVLACALAAGATGGAARAQRKRATPAANDNAAQAPKSSDQKKKVFVGRGADTPQGSRVTIKSDNPLNDYSAYRSGDRFYVVLPRADASSVARGGSGKGYTDMQVQQRGGDVVLSYRLQPGAKPRVEQKFNRLDVVFDAPEGAQGSGAAAAEASNRTAAGAENRNQNAGEQSATRNPPAQQNPNAAAGERRAGAQGPAGQAQAGSAGQTGVAAPPAASTGELPSGTGELASNTTPPAAEQTPAATPASAPTIEQQLAQAQPPAQAAPITATDATKGAQSGASLGTFLLRNWAVALIVALAVAAFGLILATRRASAPSPAALEEAGRATTLGLEGARAPRLEAPARAELRAADANGLAPKTAATDALPLVAASALASGAAVEEAEQAEASKEAKGPKGKGRRADELSVAEPSVAESAPAEQPSAEGAVVGSAEATAVEEAEAAHAAPEAGEKPGPEAVTRVVAAEAEAEPSKGIAPAAPPDHEAVEAETRRLLEGGSYDRSVVGTSDAMARQLVAAELLAALAGRNRERRERARAAFVEHGYFDEKARDLREAQAPAERAAAARSLAITGDRAATPHLVAALGDESAEVRRAAVEALGSLRDPSAVEPLESLLAREKGFRNVVPGRVIRHALENCREAAEQARAAGSAPARAAVETAEAAPAVEAAEVAKAAEPPVETAGAEGAARAVGIEPVPEAPSVAEGESAVALAPVADEVAEPEAVTASEEAAGVTAVEAAPAEEVHAAEAARPIAELPTAFESFEPIEPPRAEIEPAPEARAVEPRAKETVPVAEPSAEVPAAVTGIEPAAGAQASEAAGHPAVVERGVEPSAAAEPELPFEEGGAAQKTRGIVAARGDVAEPAAGESSAEIIPVKSGEWVDVDLSGAGPGAQPAAERALWPTAAEAAAEAAPPAEDERAVEHVPVGAVEKEIVPGRPEGGVTPHASEAVEAAPAAAAADRGVTPFDEFSTVPASIQQRLASGDAAERAAAITELSHAETDGAFQQICAAFDDEATEVRSAAARALYELRSDRAESFTRALREATPERRRHIGVAISSSGLANEAISQLTGESREKTYEAFSLLFLMAKAGEVQPLIRAIEAHQNSEVRLAVVKLLALSGQKEILPAFRRLAVRGSLPTEVRSAVMEAIYQISSSQPSAA
jgi:HEAT repeat protein